MSPDDPVLRLRPMAQKRAYRFRAARDRFRLLTNAQRLVAEAIADGSSVREVSEATGLKGVSVNAMAARINASLFGITRRPLQVSDEEVEYPEDVERPRTRGDCVGGQRPCPFVSCSHHLYLDANPKTGAIKLNFPHLEVWEMPETCSLDVADRGGITLEEVGAVLNLTRERVRQIQDVALAKVSNSTLASNLK